MGIAMQALVDEDLDPEEKRLFLQLARCLEVPEAQALEILDNASRPKDEVVAQIREHLLHSKYKYYFILDLQIMAHQDRKVKGVETRVIEEFGQLLQVDPEDIHFLTELADAVVECDPDAKEQWVDSFFQSLNIRQEAKPEDFAHYIKVDPEPLA